MGPHHHFRHSRAPTDMRKIFCGLCGLVHSGLNRDLFSGKVFGIINRRRMHIELLIWDRNGFLGLHIFKLGFGSFCRDGPSK